MLHIKLIIPKTIKNLRKRKDTIDEKIIYQEAERIIKKNTPDIEVFFYKNKNLYIRCFNSATANELFLNQEKIIDKINQSLDRKAINKLIIKTR